MQICIDCQFYLQFNFGISFLPLFYFEKLERAMRSFVLFFVNKANRSNEEISRHKSFALDQNLCKQGVFVAFWLYMCVSAMRTVCVRVLYAVEKV